MIKDIIIDVDGVLTDNKVWYDHNGERSKGFNSSDIWAIRELIANGYRVVLMTASTWPGMQSFAQRTGAELAVTREKIWGGQYAAIGNDVWDVDLLKKAKKAFCPADSEPCVTSIKGITVLQKKGGDAVISDFLSFLPL